MIKFVIIDSDKEWQKTIKKIIMEIAFELENMVIETYNSLNPDLEKTINDNYYHKIYILDVDLASSISGLDIAKLIRDNDHFSHLIFLTNCNNMFEEVHRNLYEVYSFIEKTHNTKERLFKAIKSIVDIEFNSGIFCYSNRNIDLQIFYKDILYIERDTVARKLNIHTKQSTFIVNISIEKMLTLLDKRFRRVYRSCIVNNEEVLLYNWSKGEFVLKNGLKVPLLSKRFRKKVSTKITASSSQFS